MWWLTGFKFKKTLQLIILYTLLSTHAQVALFYIGQNNWYFIKYIYNILKLILKFEENRFFFL